MFDNFTLDGVNNTDPNFNTYVVLPSIDALQEFKVQTGVYPAEFGHNSTQINVSTKPGGNHYHGALFEFLRNDKLDAKPYAFAANPPAKSPFKWNQYGFELDGPVRIPKLFNGRDKLFFMANYESFRQRRNFNGIYTVPTAAMFGGDFSGISTYHLRPRTPRRRSPATSFPRNRIDPISKKLLNYYPPANIATPRSRTTTSASAARRSTKTSSFPVWTSSSPRNRSGPAGIAGATKTSPTPASRSTATKTITNFEQYMGSNTRTFYAEHGQRGPVRLYALLQLHRHLSRLQPRTWSAKSAFPVSNRATPCSGASRTSP